MLALQYLKTTPLRLTNRSTPESLHFHFIQRSKIISCVHFCSSCILYRNDAYCYLLKKDILFSYSFSSFFFATGRICLCSGRGCMCFLLGCGMYFLEVNAIYRSPELHGRNYRFLMIHVAQASIIFYFLCACLRKYLIVGFTMSCSFRRVVNVK